MTTYNIRFKPVNPNELGQIIHQFTTDAESEQAALEKVLLHLESSQILKTHELESITLTGSGVKIPILNIPMMSDEKWCEIAEKAETKTP
ncbi:MAG: hypothetical protein PWP30_2157 [Eubacteriaceae bacterium]|nr:hypothetical protein [Eubacteriaceae bacterium]